MLNRRDALIGLTALGAGTAYAFWPSQRATDDFPLFDISANAQSSGDVEVVEYTLGDPNAPVDPTARVSSSR